jgi:hypothetical protein
MSVSGRINVPHVLPDCADGHHTHAVQGAFYAAFLQRRHIASRCSCGAFGHVLLHFMC